MPPQKLCDVNHFPRGTQKKDKGKKKEKTEKSANFHEDPCLVDVPPLLLLLPHSACLRVRVCVLSSGSFSPNIKGDPFVNP